MTVLLLAHTTRLSSRARQPNHERRNERDTPHWHDPIRPDSLERGRAASSVCSGVPVPVSVSTSVSASTSILLQAHKLHARRRRRRSPAAILRLRPTIWTRADTFADLARICQRDLSLLGLDGSDDAGASHTSPSSSSSSVASFMLGRRRRTKATFST